MIITIDVDHDVMLDILVMSQIMVHINYQQFINILTGHVNSCVIPVSRIVDTVTQILRVKFAMVLFENPYVDPALAEQVGKSRDLAREAARKSLVLLKNGKTPSDAPLLPLPKKARKILVAGRCVDNLAYQCSGWIIEWQGDTSRTTVPPWAPPSSPP